MFISFVKSNILVFKMFIVFGFIIHEMEMEILDMEYKKGRFANMQWVKLKGETPRTLTSLQVYRVKLAVLMGLTGNKITQKMLIWKSLHQDCLFFWKFHFIYVFQSTLNVLCMCFILLVLVAFAYWVLLTHPSTFRWRKQWGS